jgi:hypothetical protein
VTSLKNADPVPAGAPSPSRPDRSRRALQTVTHSPWSYVVVAVVVFSYGLLRWARTSPGFDPYGWLDWGYQTVRLNLNLGGAPSWKPVTWLFNVPYAVVGHYSFWLWEVTAIAFSIGGPIVAGRIVYTIVTRTTGERWPAIAGSLFAAVSLFGIVQYTHYWLSSQSDPMLVTCVLLGVDMHLQKHSRWAFFFLWLASLGRPETWPLIGLYSIWCWREYPSMRRFLIAGIFLIGFGWFIVPVFSGQSPFVAYQLAQESPRELHGNKVIGVIDRFLDLTFWPTKVAALIGIALAAWRRDRAVLLITACGAIWLVVEIFFALRGLPGVPRYMFEAAAAMIVVGGIGIGWLLSAGKLLAAAPSRWIVPGRIVGALVVIGLAVALFPPLHGQWHEENSDITAQRLRTKEIGRLHDTIRAAGGAAFVRSCGDPTVDVEYVSILAWYTHMNVGKVGHRPQFMITKQHNPLVLFTALSNGWIIHTFHLTPSMASRCASLNNAYWVTTPQQPGGVLGHQA